MVAVPWAPLICLSKVEARCGGAVQTDVRPCSLPPRWLCVGVNSAVSLITYTQCTATLSESRKHDAALLSRIRGAVFEPAWLKRDRRAQTETERR